MCYNSAAALLRFHYGVIDMAAADMFKVELSNLDRQWVKKSLEFQRAGLVRSQRLEMPGSEIYGLRGKEITALDVLIAKFT